MVALPPRSRVRMAGFAALLAWTMAAGSLIWTSLSVLSAPIIGQLGVTRAQFGLLLTLLTLSGTLSAPVVGRIADRQGGTRTLRMLLAISVVGFLVIATAPSYGWMIVAMLVAGVAATAGNPVTNSLIAQNIPVGRRGPIVGIKHSGGQLGVLLGGLALPGAAVMIGWRLTLGLGALVPLMGLAASRLARLGPASEDGWEPRAGVGPRLGWLVLNAFTMGAGSSAVMGFLPLFAQEKVGLSVTAAGGLIAVMAAVAMGSRLAWGWWGEHIRPAVALAVIAVLSVLAVAAFAAASAGSQWTIWSGVVVAGLSMMAWHSVGMLAVLADADVRTAGRTSGVVHVAFLAGWTLSPSVFGAVIDLASYRTAWSLLGALFLFGGAAALWGVRGEQVLVHREEGGTP